jgi:hypothetical protein
MVQKLLCTVRSVRKRWFLGGNTDAIKVGTLPNPTENTLNELRCLDILSRIIPLIPGTAPFLFQVLFWEYLGAGRLLTEVI